MQTLNFQNRPKRQLKLVLQDGSDMILTIKEPTVTEQPNFNQGINDLSENQSKAIDNAKDKKEESEIQIKFSFDLIEFVCDGFDRDKFKDHSIEYITEILNALNDLRAEPNNSEKKSE